MWARGRGRRGVGAGRGRSGVGAGRRGEGGSSAAFAASPPTVRLCGVAGHPGVQGPSSEKLARGAAHISYNMFSLLLNSVSVLLSGCFRSLIDDERTFVNSPLRRRHF